MTVSLAAVRAARGACAVYMQAALRFAQFLVCTTFPSAGFFDAAGLGTVESRGSWCYVLPLAWAPRSRNTHPRRLAVAGRCPSTAHRSISAFDAGPKQKKRHAVFEDMSPRLPKSILKLGGPPWCVPKPPHGAQLSSNPGGLLRRGQREGLAGGAPAAVLVGGPGETLLDDPTVINPSSVNGGGVWPLQKWPESRVVR